MYLQKQGREVSSKHYCVWSVSPAEIFPAGLQGTLGDRLLQAQVPTSQLSSQWEAPARSKVKASLTLGTALSLSLIHT